MQVACWVALEPAAAAEAAAAGIGGFDPHFYRELTVCTAELGGEQWPSAILPLCCTYSAVSRSFNRDGERASAK